jgi:hypothetical protein
MTVCIAAICEDGQRIAVAADRMFTSPAPLNMEFESEEKKIEGLAPNCLALLSGNSGYGTEVLSDVIKRVGGNQGPSLSDVAQWITEAYAAIRARKAEEIITTPTLGADFITFRSKGVSLPGYLQPQPAIYQQMVAAMNQFNMNVEIMVSGIDTTGAHLAVVIHPGTHVWLDKLGYGAIGSGAIHALGRLNLAGQTRHRHLAETLFSVYDAKKAAEAAPGVGKETDLQIVDKAKGLIECSRTKLEILERLRVETGKKLSPNLDELKASIEERLK